MVAGDRFVSIEYPPRISVSADLNVVPSAFNKCNRVRDILRDIGALGEAGRERKFEGIAYF